MNVIRTLSAAIAAIGLTAASAWGLAQSGDNHAGHGDHRGPMAQAGHGPSTGHPAGHSTRAGSQAGAGTHAHGAGHGSGRAAGQAMGPAHGGHGASAQGSGHGMGQRAAQADGHDHGTPRGAGRGMGGMGGMGGMSGMGGMGGMSGMGGMGGMGSMGGMGGMGMMSTMGTLQNDAGQQADLGLVQTMVHGHASITRSVTDLPDGIRTLTESSDPAVASALQAHVASMMQRLETGQEFNLFSKTIPVLFENRDRIVSRFEMTSRGATVTQTSTDPKVVAALQIHAREVSELASEGPVAMRRNMQSAMVASTPARRTPGAASAAPASRPAAGQAAHNH